MRTLLSFLCQLRLKVVLRYYSLSSYIAKLVYLLRKKQVILENFILQNLMRSRQSIRAIRAELLEESLVYNYTPECITTHFLEEFSENRIRLLEG